MKLIDWTTVPDKTQVRVSHEALTGEFKGSNGSICAVSFPGLRNLGFYAPGLLQIDIAATQPYILYEEGITKIPEWAEVILIDATSLADAAYRAVMAYNPKRKPMVLKFKHVRAYRLGNREGKLFKDGWTDNPNDVTV